jgi:hypothetical protein
LKENTDGDSSLLVPYIRFERHSGIRFGVEQLLDMELSYVASSRERSVIRIFFPR